MAFSVKGYGMGHVIAQIKHPSQPSAATIVKVVNPLGTVITLPSDEEAEYPVCLDSTEYVIHENCDETLFRPIIGASNNTLVIAGRPETSSPTASSTTNLYDTVPSPSLSDSEQYYLPPETIIPCTVEKKSDNVEQFTKQKQKRIDYDDNKSVVIASTLTTTYETTVAPDGKCIRNQSPSPKLFEKEPIDTNMEMNEESSFVKIKEVVNKTKELPLKLNSKGDKKIKKEVSTKVSKIENKFSTSAILQLAESNTKTNESLKISKEREEIKDSPICKTWEQIESHSDNTTKFSNNFPLLSIHKTDLSTKTNIDYNNLENSDRKIKNKTKSLLNFTKISEEAPLKVGTVESKIETTELPSKSKKKASKKESEVDISSKSDSVFDTNMEIVDFSTNLKKTTCENLEELESSSQMDSNLKSSVEIVETSFKNKKKVWKNIENPEPVSSIKIDADLNIKVIESISKTKSTSSKIANENEIPLDTNVEHIESTLKSKKKAWKNLEELPPFNIEITEPTLKPKKKAWKTLEEIEISSKTFTDNEPKVEIVEPITKLKKKTWKNLEDVEKIDVDSHNIETIESTVRNRKKLSKNIEKTEIVSITTDEMIDESNVKIVEPKSKKKLPKNLEEFEYLDLIKVDDSKTQDSDENYVEAENCGLQIGQSCKQLEVKKKNVKKTKIKKPKNTEDFTEIIAIETASKDDMDNDEFLSLEPEYERSSDDFSCDITYPDDDIIAIENRNSESDDSSCKLVTKSDEIMDSEEIEPLIPFKGGDGSTSAVTDCIHEFNTHDEADIDGSNVVGGINSGGQSLKTTNKKKSKKKRR